MAKTTKNILSLNHEEVMDFFMKSEQYHSFELPEYFTFDAFLSSVCDVVRTTLYEKYLIEVIFSSFLSVSSLIQHAINFWLQNITYQQGKKENYRHTKSGFPLKVGDSIVTLYNNSRHWLKTPL